MQSLICGECDLFKVLVVFELHLVHELAVHPEGPHAQERLGVLQLTEHVLSQHRLDGRAQLLKSLDFLKNRTYGK